jgi:hypothetical protein
MAQEAGGKMPTADEAAEADAAGNGAAEPKKK